LTARLFFVVCTKPLPAKFFFEKLQEKAFHNVGTLTTVALSIARKSLIVRWGCACKSLIVTVVIVVTLYSYYFIILKKKKIYLGVKVK